MKKLLSTKFQFDGLKNGLITYFYKSFVRNFQYKMSVYGLKFNLKEKHIQVGKKKRV